MKTQLAPLFLLAAGMLHAQPVIADLQPHGAQKGRPFKLTIVGKGLGQETKVWSTLPGTFTPLSPEVAGAMTEGRYATFLVEPTGETPLGLYPIRVQTNEGISNIQLFAVGSFPEYTEDESRPGALPNSNDTIETAQALPSAPFTLNGTLRGPERDVFRLSAKAGERLVIEVEARRCGSAIDPELEILDGSGKPIARSEDAAMLGLDARADVTFPQTGYYYVVVHDARFSNQVANFYRLKVGSYPYPDTIYPLGGRRGEVVETSLGAQTIHVDLRSVDTGTKQTMVNLPDSASLPVPFAVGDDPEVTAPVSSTLQIPVTVNARLAKPREVHRYTLAVQPGEPLTLRIQARELGTSKLMAVLTAYDEKGNKLGRAGDEPLAEDFYNINQSQTAGDPFLRIEAPATGSTITVTVEDLALRGGSDYAYRLNVKKLDRDLRVQLGTPFVNIPAGGSVSVPVTVTRVGFDSEVALRITNAPPGLTVEGGFVVGGAPVKENPRSRGGRGVLVLTAAPDAKFAPLELHVEGVAKMPDGSEIVRSAEGLGMLVNVSGATQQGSVDRQRPVTAPWLGLTLPSALTKAPSATLEVSMVERKRMAEGDQMKFRWKWHAKDKSIVLPQAVASELVGAGDVRMIDMQPDPKDRTTGTFLITTTKLTVPSKYDLIITGKVLEEEIVSRPITVQVEEVKTPNAETASAR
jgi:hypothetical protein